MHVSMSRFRNKYGFVTIPEFEINQEIMPKHNFIIIKYCCRKYARRRFTLKDYRRNYLNKLIF